MIKRQSSIALMAMAIALGGCATAPSNHGSFVVTTEKTDTYLAQDAVAQLAQSSPPASTTLEIVNEKNDALGQAIATALRAKGYAVTVRSTPAVHTQATPLQYVFDTVSEGVFRLTLSAGSTVLSRAYVLEDGFLVPAGDWTRRE